MVKSFGRLRNRTAAAFLLSYLIVMIIPLFSSILFYYPRMRSMMVDKATEQAINSVIKIKADMDTQLLNVLSMPSYIFTNKRIILKDLLDNPLARLQAKEDLEQMIKTNTFFSHLFLYLKDIDYFIVPRSGTFYFSDMNRFPGLYQTEFGDWSRGELYELLENTDSLVVHPVNSMMIAGKKYEKMLLFVMPFPSGVFARASLIVSLPASKLDAITGFTGKEEGKTLFFNQENQLVHSSSSLNESDQASLTASLNTLEGNEGTLHTALSTGDNIIAWALSSRYGWKYVQVIPIAMIVQEALELQRNTLLVVSLVVIICLLLITLAMRINYLPIKRLASQANDFTMNKHSLKSDFDAIQLLITSLKDVNNRLEKRLDLAEPQMQEYLISKILSGNTIEVDSALIHAENLNLNLEGDAFQVLIAAYSSAQKASFACEQLSNTIPLNENGLVTAQIDTPEQIVIITRYLQEKPMTEHLLPVISGYEYVAIGQVVNSMKSISISYSTAYAALDYLKLKGSSGHRMHYEEIPERVFNPRSYPLEVMQSLESAISHANIDKFREIVSQIEAILTIEDAPPYYTRSVYLNTINILTSGYMRYLGGDNEIVRQIGMHSMLSHYTIQEMISILNATSMKLILIMEESIKVYSPYAKALSFIDNNISSSDLSLQKAADHVNMSASAFSRSFKEKVGRNFKEYVDTARIQQAKRLLRETNISIDQIGSSVGYDNLTSFYRMFKKCTGIAPGEFRQTIESK